MGLNEKFLEQLIASFQSYLISGARSNEKLKVIHSFISDSISNKFKNDKLIFYSLRNDKKSKELKIPGRYMEKAVDIAVCQDNKVLAAVGFKFVMSNYKQNSNNYFENMLGETANIRCNNIPYFQILVIPKELPYFDENGEIKTWEEINENNIHKYVVLSEDDCLNYFHTPELTLLYVVQLQPHKSAITNRAKYKKYYSDKPLTIYNGFSGFQDGVVYNNFKEFIDKLYHFIQYKYKL